jgi:hypothetical protein
MHIILKQSSIEGENDEILNMFYCSNQTIIRNWIKEFIRNDIITRKENDKQINDKINLTFTEDFDKRQGTYEINDAETNFQLIKLYKKISKGYIYNSSEKLSEIIYKISVLEFDECSTPALNNEKWSDINNEINNRVLKQLDQNSLYQIIIELESKIRTKSTWNRTEYVGLVSETIQKFKKSLYSTVAKRMKRFGKAKPF